MPAAQATSRIAKPALVVGVVLIVAAVAGRQWLLRAFSEFDPAPLPRAKLNAPFITSSDRVVDKMVELADLDEDDLVYDLGCGDGRIVITAALQSGCRGVGFDIDPERVAEAQANVALHEVGDRVTIREQDIFQVDLNPADAALMYLLPWMMDELVPQFDKMRPGTRIVSHEFWIEGVRPQQVVDVLVDEGDRSSSHSIYVYIAPLQKDSGMERGKPPRPADAVAR